MLHNLLLFIINDNKTHKTIYAFIFTFVFPCSRISDDDNPTRGLDIDMSLYIGREFSSYEAFETVLDARRNVIGDRWKVKHSVTVSDRNKVVTNPSLHLPEQLRYYDATFRCIHEGERLTAKWKPKGGCVKFHKP